MILIAALLIAALFWAAVWLARKLGVPSPAAKWNSMDAGERVVFLVATAVIVCGTLIKLY